MEGHAPARMKNQVLHYSIIEEIGRGGMGVVYKAEDTKLKRTVAIKFLPRQIAASEEERARFKIEAQAAAALNHPNIATIYAIEEVDDELFIVMEYIEGKELRELINIPLYPVSKGELKKSPLERGAASAAGGVLPVADVINYATQIAEGLQAAHKKGVIHRDIKSSNIMITDDGRVKIMDFGLAKIHGVQITQIGTTVGTMAYVSPEQALGENVGPWSDIWSLGVVFYEMLTGRLPFQGDYDQVMIYSILNQKPVFPGLIPARLQLILQKMLEKNWEDRYRNVAEFLIDLRDFQDKPSSANIQMATAGEKPIPAILVLPFANFSADKENEYFSDGMTEELIDALTKIKHLRVGSRTSSFAFKGKEQDVRKIGASLNLSHIIEGSVRKSQNRLRITAQLISVSDGFHLWSEKYDRELKDIFEIQEEIAANIVSALQVVLSEEEKARLGKAQTDNVEAYDFYLRGRQFLNEFTKHSIDYAQQMFLNAIAIDPNYALAYTGTADCHTWRYQWWERTQTSLDEALEFSRKALQLDANLAEAHVAYAWAITLSHNYAEAATAFETAIKLNPKLYEAYYLYARSCFAEGNAQKAAELFEMAHSVQPEEYQAIALLDVSYTKAGFEQKAIEASKRAFVSIEHHLQLNPDDTRAICLGANSLLAMGETEKALEWANRALANDKGGASTMYNVACVFAKAGKTEEAIDHIEQALKNNTLHREWLDNDPDMDPLRDNPRFQKLMETLK
jgi:non-specific serine/threonine protein kinase